MNSEFKPGAVWGRSLVLALAVVLLIRVPLARAESPLDGVRHLIEEVQTILKNNPPKTQRADLIEKAAARHVDFREMAKLSLENTWPTLSPKQQDEFVRVFSELLKAHYAQHLDDFANTRVDYQGATNKADGCEVCIVVLRPNDKIPVNFRMRQEPQGWMIYDMVIEGVSLVDNFRTQFGAVIKEGSYKELVRCLKNRLKAECRG